MLSVFQAIDEELGRLIELAGDEATVIVFSGHGMGAQFHGRDLIPALLELWGMNAEENIEPGSAPEKRIFVRRSLVQWIKTTIPIQLQYVVKRLLPKAIEDAIICRVMGTKKLDPSVRASYVPNNRNYLLDARLDGVIVLRTCHSLTGCPIGSWRLKSLLNLLGQLQRTSLCLLSSLSQLFMLPQHFGREA